MDLMEYITEDDKRILHNKRFIKMSPNEWGISVAIINQYIQASLLKIHYEDTFIELDDIKKIYPNIQENIRGFDFLLKKNDKFYRVQSKIRQIKGYDPYSCKVSIKTSRKKKGPYNNNEFDYLFVSLINIKKDYQNRININNWGFSFIPIEVLRDPSNNNFLMKEVPSSILRKYQINFLKK